GANSMLVGALRPEVSVVSLKPAGNTVDNRSRVSSCCTCGRNADRDDGFWRTNSHTDCNQFPTIGWSCRSQGKERTRTTLPSIKAYQRPAFEKRKGSSWQL